MLVQGLIFQGKGSTVPIESHHTPIADEAASTGVDVRYGGAATTVTSLEAGQGSGNIDKTPTMLHDSPFPRVHILRSDEGRMQHNELMDLVTKFSNRVSRRKLRLVLLDEKGSDSDILAQEDPFKQGRKIAQIDEDEGIILVQMGVSSASIDFTTANVLVTTVGA
ncbi:hypothetical protein Tco_1417519 [Tanacetum coccineum]